MRRVAALFAVGCLAFVACGTEPSADALLAAPAAAEAQGTGRMEMTMTMTMGGAQMGMDIPEQEIVTRAQGAFDFATERSRLTMDMDLPAELMPPGVQARPCEMVTDGQIAYMSLPTDAPGYEGRAWARIDVAQIAGLDPTAIQNQDPRGYLDYFRGAGEDIEVVGTEEIRGVSTTRYRATIGVETLLEQLDEERRAEVGAQLETLGQESFPLEAWIDDDGLPRRTLIVFDSSEGEMTFRMEIDVEFYDYGEAVDVAIPDEGEVFAAEDPQLAAQAMSVCMGFPVAQQEADFGEIELSPPGP